MITVDELNVIAAQINAVISNNGELDEAFLDNVAYGMSKWETVRFAASIAVGIIAVCAP